MKRYSCYDIYRGQQFYKYICAKNNKEAAKIFEVSFYYISKWCNVVKIDKPFEGVLAHFDSGMLFRERRDLIRKEIPLKELKEIIDSYVDEKYVKFLSTLENKIIKCGNK